MNSKTDNRQGFIWRQFNLLLHAIMFYSRIPIGKISYSEENQTQSIRFFPLIGIIVGVIGGGIFMACSYILPQAVAAIISIIAMLLTSGAMHEDGLSDFFDGFGGGYTKERILEIMKDSRVGVYGAVSLTILFLFKFAIYTSIGITTLPLVIIVANASSRFMVLVMMKSSLYVRIEKSKSSHSRNPISLITLLVAFIFAGVPFVFMPWQIILSVIPVYTIILILFRQYTQKKIGGFTGDVLGALQQLCEVGFYIVFLSVTSYI